MWWKRLLCRFGWHDWTQWDNPRWLPDGKAMQWRKCNICQRQQRNVL